MFYTDHCPWSNCLDWFGTENWLNLSGGDESSQRMGTGQRRAPKHDHQVQQGGHHGTATRGSLHPRAHSRGCLVGQEAQQDRRESTQGTAHSYFYFSRNFRIPDPNPNHILTFSAIYLQSFTCANNISLIYVIRNLYIMIICVYIIIPFYLWMYICIRMYVYSIAISIFIAIKFWLCILFYVIQVVFQIKLNCFVYWHPYSKLLCQLLCVIYQYSYLFIYTYI